MTMYISFFTTKNKVRICIDIPIDGEKYHNLLKIEKTKKSMTDCGSWYENCLGINEFVVLSERRKSIVRDYDSALKIRRDDCA